MTKVTYRNDGDECVADVDSSGTLLRTYLWGPGIDALLAMTVYSDYGGTVSVASVYYVVKDPPALSTRWWMNPATPTTCPNATPRERAGIR